MKAILSILALSITVGLVSTNASAQVAASENLMDTGIVAGALFSKVKRVKAGQHSVAVIAADLIEPACNPVQMVVWVSDDTLEGDAGGATYNLGKQISRVLKVRTEKNEVFVTYSINDPTDCTKSHKETLTFEYPGAAAPLITRMVK